MNLRYRKKIFLFLSLTAILFLVAPTGALASLPTEKQFTGHVFDQSSDLYYMRARYYDPVIGRFIQPDNIIPSSDSPDVLNRYMYVKNNPLRLIDPSGNQIIGLGGEQAEYWQQHQMAIFDVVGGGFVVEGAEGLFTGGVRWALNTRVGRALTSQVDDLVMKLVPSFTPENMTPSGWGPAAEGIISRETQIHWQMAARLETKHGVTVKEGLSRIQIAEIVGEQFDPNIYASWHPRTPDTIYMVRGFTGPEFIYEEVLHRTQWLGRDPNIIRQLNERQLNLMALLDEVEVFPLQEKYFERIYGYPFPYERVDPRLQAPLVAQELTAQEISQLLSSYLPNYVHNQVQITWLTKHIGGRQ